MARLNLVSKGIDSVPRLGRSRLECWAQEVDDLARPAARGAPPIGVPGEMGAEEEVGDEVRAEAGLELLSALTAIHDAFHYRAERSTDRCPPLFEELGMTVLLGEHSAGQRHASAGCLGRGDQTRE